MSILAVVPSDSMSVHEEVGIHTWAENYYNPARHFDKVYLFSPYEKEQCEQYGMMTIPTGPSDLRSRLLEYHVDIIRAYGGYWACDMACNHKVAGVPVVVSVHDTNPDELYDSVKRADFVFCMSEAVRDLVLTKFPHPERVWILPNRYNPEIMRPMTGADFSDLKERFPARYNLLCVGRLSEQKNQDNVIKALAELGEDYHCLMVGRNDPASLKELAEKNGVLSQCHFIESIRNDELGRYYNWADVMFTPSRWEGFGIVFIEALASGAVVVTSDVRPMSEYIRHEENGLLVKEYEKPEVLAAMVRRVCEDKELAERLRSNAPSSVEQFERSRVDALEVSYYEKVLDYAKTHPPTLLDKIRCRLGC